MISGNYRKLKEEEIPEAIKKYGEAWMNESIPMLQYTMAVKNEIEAYRNGATCRTFDIFIKCLLNLPKEIDNKDTKILDVGASSAYYSEVLKVAGFKYSYRAVDFNPKFKEIACAYFPGVEFDIADARALPYADASFDIVISGSVILHNYQYEKIIDESIRVSKKYIFFHRTPFVRHGVTHMFVKEAYGVECIEIHFNIDELMQLFTRKKLTVRKVETIFFDNNEGYGHMSIMCEK